MNLFKNDKNLNFNIFKNLHLACLIYPSAYWIILFKYINRAIHTLLYITNITIHLFYIISDF